MVTERLGLADAQNIALNQRLEESFAAIDKAMPALPVSSEDIWLSRRSWQL